MTGIEILLLVIGVIIFIASFFITEKLTPGELGKIGELSNPEIERVMECELQRVSAEIEGKVQAAAEEALLSAEQSMEEECSEKMNTIREYSDTVLESMNKTHNEIMFLYSMLNDKHAELTKLSTDLQELASSLEKKDEEIANRLMQDVTLEGMGFEQSAAALPEDIMQPESMPEQKKETEHEKAEEESNHNDAILELYREGKSSMEIARTLALGLGEVQLVIGLYEGKRK